MKYYKEFISFIYDFSEESVHTYVFFYFGYNINDE